MRGFGAPARHYERLSPPSSDSVGVEHLRAFVDVDLADAFLQSLPRADDLEHRDIVESPPLDLLSDDRVRTSVTERTGVYTELVAIGSGFCLLRLARRVDHPEALASTAVAMAELLRGPAGARDIARRRAHR